MYFACPISYFRPLKLSLYILILLAAIYRAVTSVQYAFSHRVFAGISILRFTLCSSISSQTSFIVCLLLGVNVCVNTK